MNKEKNLIDYIHLYPNCRGHLKMVYYSPEKETKLVDAEFLGIVFNGLGLFQCYDINGVKWGNTSTAFIKDFTPFLRPLSDMTKQERQEYESIGEVEYNYSNGVIYHNGTEVYYLLSKGFDLFELIPAGLAFDVTKLSISKSIK